MSSTVGRRTAAAVRGKKCVRINIERTDRDANRLGWAMADLQIDHGLLAGMAVAGDG